MNDPSVPTLKPEPLTVMVSPATASLTLKLNSAVWSSARTAVANTVEASTPAAANMIDSNGRRTSDSDLCIGQFYIVV